MSIYSSSTTLPLQNEISNGALDKFDQKKKDKFEQQTTHELTQRKNNSFTDITNYYIHLCSYFVIYKFHFKYI